MVLSVSVMSSESDNRPQMDTLVRELRVLCDTENCCSAAQARVRYGGRGGRAGPARRPGPSDPEEPPPPAVPRPRPQVPAGRRLARALQAEIWLYLRGVGTGRKLVCKVFDCCRGWRDGDPPPPAAMPPDAVAGRGLQIVHELSGGRWGHHATRGRMSRWGQRGNRPAPVHAVGGCLRGAGQRPAQRAPGGPGTSGHAGRAGVRERTAPRRSARPLRRSGRGSRADRAEVRGAGPWAGPVRRLVKHRGGQRLMAWATRW
jgi:hypothetical protein